jgi:CBS domain-containing protein
MAGFLTLGQIKQVPREYWDLTTAGQAMTPAEQVKAVRPSDDAVTVLEQMEEENLNLVAVVEEGKFLGTILRDVLIQFALSLQEPKH